jgi:purine-binding chemotaxis protein CheW
MAIDRTAMKSALTPASGQFSTFFVADLFFGVDVLDVQEVLRSQQMTPVPQAPEIVEGLINLRGQIVTAIDMRRRLQLPPQAGDRPSMNIVIRTPDGAVSLLVDEIGDVLEMDGSAYERPPQNLDPGAREIIRGVYKMKDGLLLVLDTEKAIEVSSCRASQNGHVGAQKLQTAAGGKSPHSSLVEDMHDESSNTTQLQSPAKQGNKKKTVRNTGGAARGVQAESG